MQSVNFPMTSTGFAGYKAPGNLEDARNAVENGNSQHRANEILRNTTDCVEFLKSQDVKTGADSNGCVDSLARRNADLNPAPNTVVVAGSNLDFVSGEKLPDGGCGGEAFLQLNDSRTGDILSSVDKLEVNQADGLRINISRTADGAENIHYMDNKGEFTVIRDAARGVLTIIDERV